MIITNIDELKKKVLMVSNRLSNDANQAPIEESVHKVLSRVKTSGLEALKEFTKKFDKQDIDNFWVSTKNKYQSLSQTEQDAIELAANRIQKFQQAIKPQNIVIDQELSIRYTPIESVGIYIPGGSAPLLSTVLMTVIPAQVAGVSNIIVTSPPPVSDYILGVADYLGIEQILQAGGIQAIGALAYGIPELNLKPVDKICGPGNAYVTVAKKQVLGEVGIDALYGPSELVIIADESASSDSVSYDLMSQLEHGSGWEAACLLTNSESFAESVLNALEKNMQNQPNKLDIERAWSNYGFIGVVSTIEDAINLSNLFAPEHLELKVQDAGKYLDLISNAGAIFYGGANEAFGDYVAGPSHCLPTGRSARFSSGLSSIDFMKRHSMVCLEANDELIQATATLARMEGLEAHAQSAENI